LADTISAHFWVSEPLALCWTSIPTRLGYAVDPVPADLTRSYWEAQAAGEGRRIEEGYRDNDVKIDPELVELAISRDHSAFVVTGGAVIYVVVNQDLLQSYDSTSSWWAEARMLFARERGLLGYDKTVEFRLNHSRLAMRTLTIALLASGAMEAFQKPLNHGLGWERHEYHSSTRIITCPLEMAMKWPALLLESNETCCYVPVCPAPHPPVERYISGTIKGILGGIRIYSGPACYDSQTQDAAFLAIEPYGWFSGQSVLDKLTKKAIACGGKLLHR